MTPGDGSITPIGPDPRATPGSPHAQTGAVRVVLPGAVVDPRKDPRSIAQAEQIMATPVALGYRPQLPVWGARGAEVLGWHFFADVEVMRLHPDIFLPLEYVLGPLEYAEWGLEASSRAAAVFAAKQLQWWWLNALPDVAEHGYIYGWDACELTYTDRDGAWVFDKCIAFNPRDVVPLLTVDDRRRRPHTPVGVRVTQLIGGVTDLWAWRADVPNKAFWYAHRPEGGQRWGRSQIRGAWRFWRRLAGIDGIEEISDLATHRFGCGVMKVLHPDEQVRAEAGALPGYAEGGVVHTRDIARFIAQQAKAGAGVTLPSVQWPQMAGGGPKWDVKAESFQTNIEQLGAHADRLARSCSKAIGVPPELFEAAQTGSGYSGRAIPLQGFLVAQQKHLQRLTVAVLEQMILPLVRWNFGPKAWVRLTPKPLTESVRKSSWETPGDPESMVPPNPGVQPGGPPDPGGGGDAPPGDGGGGDSPGGPKMMAARADVIRLRRRPDGSYAAELPDPAGLDVPELVAVRDRLAGSRGELTRLLAVRHAQKGGQQHGGTLFEGGQFLPADADEPDPEARPKAGPERPRRRTGTGGGAKRPKAQAPGKGAAQPDLWDTLPERTGDFTTAGRERIWVKAGKNPALARAMAHMGWHYLTPVEQGEFLAAADALEEEAAGAVDQKKPAAPAKKEAEEAPRELDQPGGQPDRLPAGQPVGADARPAPAADRPGPGVGAEPGRPVPGVPQGPDDGGDGAGRGAGGAGGGDDDGRGAGAAGPAVAGPGRDPAADPLGDGGGGGGPDGGGGPPAGEVVAASYAEPPTVENPTDLAAGNWRYADRAWFKMGPKARVRANIEATRILKQIQAEGREAATPEEQVALSKFSGWGSFPGLFNERDGDFDDERDEVRRLIGDDEWRAYWDAARKSTLNAHYTHPSVVDAHWQVARRLGFDGGRYLEPSAGIGYYLGLMPKDLADRTHVSAVEIEPTTAAICKLLYPKAHVEAKGFEEHDAPDGFYDLVASNVPFGKYTVFDPRYNKFKASIHDYFFLKSADKVRPGGLVMHLTSRFTLDKDDSKGIRDELATKLDLVGALRFPSGTHQENAGTDVITDLLVFRKRLAGEPPGDRSWLEMAEVPDADDGEPIAINRYFADHPEMVLGRLDRSGTMFQSDGTNVARTPDFEQRLAAAIEKFPAGALAPREVDRHAFTPNAQPAPAEVKVGGYHVAGGKLWVHEATGGLSEVPDVSPEAAERIGMALGVRDAVRKVFHTELSGEDAGEARRALNAAYDQFHAKYGPLNRKATKRALRGDPDLPVLLALEKYDPATDSATKADVFVKQTIRPDKTVERAGTPEEALGVSLHEFGRLNLGRMADLVGWQPEQVGTYLVGKGLAFEDPAGGYHPAEHYLSGNVRRKLAEAKAAANADPRFVPNVEALLKVQPEDVPYTEIDVKMGAPWVPVDDYRDFAAELLGGERENFHVGRLPHNGVWLAEWGQHFGQLQGGAAATTRWGTPQAPFMTVLRAALNNTPIVIHGEDSDGKKYVDQKATEDANGKVAEMKEKFREWVWEHDDRRDRLHRYYNDNFNNIRAIKYSGQHQRFPGMNAGIQVHPHIKDAVWQVVTTGKGLLAHEVGTGKTYAMIASAMELRRLGLARKPAIACLKANVEAITRDAQQLYPGIKILSTVDQFDADDRQAAISRIATGDYDLVILTHDHLKLLPMKKETQAKFIREELEDLENALLEAERAAEAAGEKTKGNRIIKQLEKQKEQLSNRLKEATDPTKKDDAVTFEETGIDQLFVDEAHYFKNLPCYTRQRNLKGVPTSASQRATDLYMKAGWLQDHQGGRGVVFATGTPVANSMAEMYVMQKYLQPSELRERNIHSFDAWANTFGDVVSKQEVTTTGEYKEVSRFAKFVNLPELMQIARQVMDVVKVDDLPVNPATGKRPVVRPDRVDRAVVSPRTDGIGRLMADLRQRAQAVKSRAVLPDQDNMLAICTDGRKGSIDLRMVYPDAPDDPQSKTNQCVRNVLDHWKAHPDTTQMIFSDLGANPMAETGFYLYGDLIDKLVAGGIPREKIADFSKLDGAKKEAAQEGLRSGDILVAIGSTQKLGTGVNAQNRLAVLHHLDCPWRPADIEQRDGRGWRHGNKNSTGKVEIKRYLTEGSLDQMFWQVVGTKAAFIKQVMTPGVTTAREAADVDTDELSPDELSAIASGDPRILQKIQLVADIDQLKKAQERHGREQDTYKSRAKREEYRIPELKQRAESIRADADALDANPDFSLEIDGVTYDERKAAGPALEQKAARTHGNRYGTARVATYRGLRVVATESGLGLEGDGGVFYPTGDTLASIEAVARTIRGKAAATERDMEEARKGVEAVKAAIGKPFARAADLEKKRADLKALEDDLAGKNKVAEGEPAGAAGDSNAGEAPAPAGGPDVNDRQRHEYTDERVETAGVKHPTAKKGGRGFYGDPAAWTEAMAKEHGPGAAQSAWDQSIERGIDPTGSDDLYSLEQYMDAIDAEPVDSRQNFLESPAAGGDSTGGESGGPEKGPPAPPEEPAMPETKPIATDEQALVDAMAAAPADAAPRLIYADWLDEHGRAGDAGGIRRLFARKATGLPRAPEGVTVVSHAEMRNQIKAKFVPREPRVGESVLRLKRPQTGPYQFHEYAAGDLVRAPGGGPQAWVVTAVKPGYTRSGEGWKVWEQLVVARPATEADHAAVADKKAAEDAETRRVLDNMMNR